MKGKRFISIVVLLFCILSGVIFSVSSKAIFKKCQNDEQMLESYEDKKEKCNLLRAIAEEAIQPGTPISIEKIPGDKVQYKIYNDDENTIFSYYLKGDRPTEDQYFAEITLSSKYEILNEEYRPNLVPLEEYAKSYSAGNKQFAIAMGIVSLAVFYMATIILYAGFKSYMEKKKQKLVDSSLNGGKDTIKLFREHYVVHGHEKYVLTAKQLHERVMRDSKSDYNWIAPTRELVRICKKTNFPQDYALDIKIAILNCWANDEHKANHGGVRYVKNPVDEEAVHYCYNSLYGSDNEKAVEARERYLTEIIASASYISSLKSNYHPGQTYRKLRGEWRNAQFAKYISEKDIDFTKLEEILHEDFTKLIKTAEENGEFEGDEQKEKEWYRNMFKVLESIDL